MSREIRFISSGNEGDLFEDRDGVRFRLRCFVCNDCRDDVPRGTCDQCGQFFTGDWFPFNDYLEKKIDEPDKMAMPVGDD